MAESKIVVEEQDVTVAPVEENVELTGETEAIAIEVTEAQVVIEEGVSGPQGIPGESDKHYEHDQSTPANEWTIEHNLGKKPAVTIVDSGGTEWQAEVEHLSENVCVARFAYAFSGKAYLN